MKTQDVINTLRDLRDEIEENVRQIRCALDEEDSTTKQRAEHSWLHMIDQCLRSESDNPDDLSLDDTILDLTRDLTRQMKKYDEVQNG